MEEYKLLQPSFKDGDEVIELRDYQNGDYRIIRKVPDREEKTLWQGSLKDLAIGKFRKLIDPFGDEGRKIESVKARIIYKNKAGKTIEKQYLRLRYAWKFRTKLIKEGVEHEFYSLKEGFKDLKL